MDKADPELLRIWEQKTIPMIYRQGKAKPLLVRLPYHAANGDWLRGENRNKPKWNTRFKCWETPKAWFDELVKRCLARHSQAYVIQPFQSHQKCAPSCWNAVGAECECSCMGANHGSRVSHGRWHVVSDTFAIMWEDRQYACRLLQQPS